ncbi:MAG TPA: AcvB/VirJ family lysyl-phosphatidylglycerol hydrolase [Stenotrophomonas sp.]|nr:AcvB/VirJ family lysyl-phosphatidylglycerol hydrolase [Stenotrophomonas sp.]
MPLRDLIRVLPAAWALAIPVATAAPEPAPQQVSHGRFENVPVLQPQEEPQRVVLWFAGDRRNAAARQRQAEALRADGALVAMVDTAHLYEVLGKDPGKCVFSSGDVENFSRYVQAYLHIPTYRLPLLVGDGEGSALVYAVAAQAPANVLAGVLTDDLCPAAVPPRGVCGAGVGEGGTLQAAKLPVPWLAAKAAPGARCAKPASPDLVAGVAQARVLERGSDGDLLPGLRAAVRSLGSQRGVSLPPPPADLQGLPVVEVPAQGQGDTFAIFVSGDGGWAGLDKQVAAKLAASGISVVGVDSLRYFWSERTPAGFAADLDRIARFYAHRWQRPKLVLIGFSQGADVLPAAIAHLPAATRKQLALTALLSVGKLADYEFHVSNWLGSDDEGLPIAPEIARLDPARTLCIYGEADADTLCPELPANATRRFPLPGDHHFKGDYATLAELIVRELGKTPPPAL